MNAVSVNVTEMSRNFSEYLNRVYYNSEHFLLVRGGKKLAEINPLPLNKKLKELSELLKTLPKLSDDDVTQFSNDIKESDELFNTGLADPWAV